MERQLGLSAKSDVQVGASSYLRFRVVGAMFAVAVRAVIKNSALQAPMIHP